MSHRSTDARPSKSSHRNIPGNGGTPDVEAAGLTAYLAEDLHKYMMGSTPITRLPYAPKSPAKRSLQAYLEGEKDTDVERRGASHRRSELLWSGDALTVIHAVHGGQHAHGSMPSTQSIRHRGSTSNSRYELIQLRPQPIPLPTQQTAAISSSVVSAQPVIAPSIVATSLASASTQVELQAYLRGDAGTVTEVAGADDAPPDVGADLGPSVATPNIPPPTLLHLKQKPKRLRSTKGVSQLCF